MTVLNSRVSEVPASGKASVKYLGWRLKHQEWWFVRAANGDALVFCSHGEFWRCEVHEGEGCEHVKAAQEAQR